MRSIFFAMAWDALKRGRWLLPIGFLGGNVLSVALFSTLRMSPIGQEFILWHMVATQVNILCFGATVVNALGKPERFFTMPISNRTLGAYSLIIGMSLMIAESLVSTMLMNAMYGVGWPYWGPAFFGAASLAAAYTGLWCADRSLWLGVELSVAGLIGGLWFRCRYGPIVWPTTFASLPRHERIEQHYEPWVTLTFGELLTLLAVSLIAYFVGVVGLGWRRRGEAPLSVGFVDWVRRFLESPLEIGRPFRSPAEAQIWFERRQKAIMPLMVITGLVAGFLFWLIFDRDPRLLFGGVYYGGYSLIAAGLICGFVCGNTSSGSPNPEIGHFLGTRPMTSKDMANTILKVVAQSVATGWLIWIAAVAVLYLVLLVLWAFDVFGFNRIDMDFRVIGDSLVGSWMAAGVGMTFLLIGRTKTLTIVVFSLMAVWIAWLLAKGFFVPKDMQAALNEIAMSVVGVVGIVVTGAAFALAGRARLISLATMLSGIGIWMVLTVIALTIVQQRHISVLGLDVSFPAALFVTGIASLAAAPLATAPLALACNRVR